MDDRIVREDIDALNRTMRARSPVWAWSELIERGRLDWLVALGRDWDAIALDDAKWHSLGCSEALAGALDGIKGLYIERTLVRVFDALLWSTHPASELGPVPDLLSDWAARGVLSTCATGREG